MKRSWTDGDIDYIADLMIYIDYNVSHFYQPVKSYYCITKTSGKFNTREEALEAAKQWLMKNSSYNVF